MQKIKIKIQTGIVDTEEDIIVFISVCNRTNLFFPLPMSHWKLVNIYCTSLNTDTHKYKVTSPGFGLISLGGNQGNETERANPTFQ